MIVRKTKLEGVLVLELERFEDERGFFARAWSEKELAALGVDHRFVEGNVSHNIKRGTLRGMHYQAAPHAQAKLVRCTRGTVYDVAVDIRPGSPTFGQSFDIELTDRNGLMLYVPGDCGHGYLTLEDDTEVYYQVTGVYKPESSRGFRWDDPAFNIDWPQMGELLINERDLEYPDFKP